MCDGVWRASRERPPTTVAHMSVAPNPASVSGYEARWEQHNAERRSQILLAMIELLEESPPGADISVAAIAKRAYREQRPVLEIAREDSGLPEAELKRLLDPAALTRGGIHDQ